MFKKIAFQKYWLTGLLLFVNMVLILPSYAQPTTDEQLAVQYFQAGEYDKAAEIFEKLYNTKPSQLIYDYFLKSLIEIKDYKRAEKFIVKVQKKLPSNQLAQVDLGYIYQLEGNYDKAKKQYENCIKLLYPDIEIVKNLASAFEQKKLTDYAIKTFEQGRKLLKDQYYFNLELAELYLKLNNHVLAIEYLLQQVEFVPMEMDPVKSILQDMIVADDDNSRGEVLRTSLLQKIKKQPDIREFSSLLLWYFIQLKDFSAAANQAKALDKRFNEDGSGVFALAQIAVSNGFYEDAIDCYDYVISKKGEFSVFYQASLLERLNAKYLKITSSPIYSTNELNLLESEMQELLTKQVQGDATVKLLIDLAHIKAFYLGKSEQAIELLQQGLTYKNISTEVQSRCKIKLADILLLTDNVWDASLLYMQVEKMFKNDVIGFEAKFKNARLYYFINEFDYAKAQLNILRAATAKLIANDAMELALLISDNMDEDSTYTGLSFYARAEKRMFQHKYTEALQTLDSISSISLTHPLFDEVLYKKALIYISQQQYLLADSMLTKLVEFYPYDILADDGLFLSAELNETKLNDVEKSKALYFKIITDYPASIFVVEARKRYRNLRGDKIN